MTDDGLTGLFQTQFSTLLRMNLQQKTSKLRGKTEEGSHTGSNGVPHSVRSSDADEDAGRPLRREEEHPGCL